MELKVLVAAPSDRAGVQIRRRLQFVALMAAIAAILSACLPPNVDGRPSVAVINAPTEYREAGLAEGFQDALRRDPASSLYGFTFPAGIRFQEAHRDMHGSGADLQAAFIARSKGAELALMIAAPVYSRRADTVTAEVGGLPFSFYFNFLFSPPQDSRSVEVIVRLQAVIIDPESAERLALFTSPEIRRYRLEANGQPLVAAKDDTDLQAAVRQALEELALPVATELANLLSASEPDGQ